ncbi:TniQ family protein [Roseateles toxinivorans]|nr:TniQ family protein [Roseateles toxinivorans]
MTKPPERAESASGYMLRLLSLNGVGVREALALCRATRRRVPQAADTDLLSGLAGISAEWFDHRTPRPYVRDQWNEVALFGFTWRDAWLLRGFRQQVCPLCIREQGIARLEWDLVAYPVCHIHGIVLQDACRICGKGLSPNRPALDVCGCGGYFAARDNETSAATPSVKAWTVWLSQQLLADAGIAQQSGLLPFAPQLHGASPDGAYRLICAYAGGAKAFRGELILAGRPWLSSHQVSRLIAQGLDALHAAAGGAQTSIGLGSGTPYALAEQAVAGITAWDRAVASREMLRLRLGRRWRNALPRCPSQQELFADVS